jgi:hypothetical protein
MRLLLRPYVLVLFGASLLAACGSRAQSIPDPPPVPGGGTIAGIYFEANSAGADGRPVDGVSVGAFDQQFLPGTLVHNPPRALARDVTVDGGRFLLKGLTPGRYFVVADTGSVTGGKWVEVGADRGASLVLLGCTDCPPVD